MHDLFISHSSQDKTAADGICAQLEAHGIRCWIAPRDILPGANWGSSIMKGLREARIMLLIFTKNANASPHIKKEVERAVNARLTIIPMRLADILPEDDLEYFLGNAHWLDAFTPPIEHHVDRLALAIKQLLEASPPRGSDPIQMPLAVADLTPRINIIPPVETAASHLAEHESEPAIPDAVIAESTEVSANSERPPESSPLPMSPADNSHCLPPQVEQLDVRRAELNAEEPFSDRKRPVLALGIIAGVIVASVLFFWLSCTPSSPISYTLGTDNNISPTLTAASSSSKVEIPSAPAPSTHPAPIAPPASIKYDLQTSLETVTTAATMGNPEAEAALGMRYEKGNGVPQNYDTAKSWFKKAADQNDPKGQARYANLLYRRGTEADYPIVVKLFQASADQGDAEGQDGLGLLYQWGSAGLKQDKAKSFELLQKSAAEGCPDGEADLSNNYSMGIGITQDPAQSFALATKSDAAGDAWGTIEVAQAYEEGAGVGAIDLDKARKYYLAAVAEGDNDGNAEADLAMLEKKAGNTSVAIDWYKKSVDQGDANSAYTLGTMFEKGDGVPADKPQAILWYQKEADLGEARGKDNVTRLQAAP